MLPHTMSEENVAQTSRKVFINPNLIAAAQLGNESLVTQQLQLLLYQQKQQQQQYQGRCLPGVATPSIHINPQFLQRKLLERQKQQMQQLELNTSRMQHSLPSSIEVQTSLVEPRTQANTAKIISKSSTKLVRKFSTPQMNMPKSTAPTVPASMTTFAPIPTPPPLISLSKRKLIRHVTTTPIVIVDNKTPSRVIAPALSSSKYKIDRRARSSTVLSTPLIKKRNKCTFVARYALRRVTQHVINNKLSTNPMTSKFKGIRKRSSNNTLQLLNIHGVLYKSTRNKLQRKESTSSYASISANGRSTTKGDSKASTDQTAIQGRTIFVRGTEFVMDAKGFNLTLQPSHSAISPSHRQTSVIRQRIDIGGLTFIASPNTQNVFVRTSNHVSRAHLMSAKQRSMQLLNRSLVKTNVPCAIFQRLGKCVAHERGKCHKLHDKRQVSICGNFLRGECNKRNCLLSHNVSLAKMPVCKFFLQAACVRDDCPYLHKKLSDSAAICMDFLRGYCSRADKCNKRHEFLCPEYERKGKCKITNCVPCSQMRNQMRHVTNKRKKQLESESTTSKTTSIPKGAEPINRYFETNMESSKNSIITGDDNNDEAMQDDSDASTMISATDENQPIKYKIRPKLGKLPSYIPFL